MARDPDTPALDPGELADLSALADGTLDPVRREEVRSRIAASGELTALYERERRAVEMLHELRASDRAPQALRQKIEAAQAGRGRAGDRAGRRAPARGRRPRGRIRFSAPGAIAGMVSAGVIVLVLLLLAPGGTPGSPSVSQAAGLATLGSTGAAPAPDPSDPSVKLGRNVGAIYFPNWVPQFHWQATGQRADRIDGRSAVTVYYAYRGQTIAYTIVAAPALKEPPARVTTFSNRTEYRTLTLDGRLVVTWQRDDHTCVLSGVGVAPAALQRLAAWTPTGLTHGS